MWLATNMAGGKGLTIRLLPDVDRSFLWGMPSVVSADGAFTIKYPVGQSCLLAGAIGLGGTASAFCLVPVLGLITALCLALSTYALSRNLRLSWLAAAVLLACPTWMIHSRSLLSDVPATATVYAAILLCLLGRSGRRRYLFLAAGVVLGAGIMIRYQTVLALFPIWLLLYVPGTARAQALNTACLGLPCVAAAVLILSLNQHLFGSPWTTGYAAIGEQGLNAGSMVRNVLNYSLMSCVLLPGAGIALVRYARRPAGLIGRRPLAPFLLLPVVYIVFCSAWGNLAQLSYKPQDLLVLGARLILPAVPAFALLLSLAAFDCSRRLGLPHWTVWVLPICLLGASFCVRRVFERRTREYAAANEFLSSETSPMGLVLLKPHWFKIIWPHDPSVRYTVLSGSGISPSQSVLIARHLRLGQPVRIVADPYVRLGVRDPSWQQDSLMHALRLNGFTGVRRAGIHDPFEVEIYEVRPGARPPAEGVTRGGPFQVGSDDAAGGT
ncbi:MAG: glycosyltransferase family 39 protein [Kiritimatiellae bacterium]|nr:glycosyltransferase family 39 protein [Kiritimatiellia bacterium]